MPANEQVRITFFRIELSASARSIGSGRFRFTASIGSQTFGNGREQSAQVDTRTGSMVIDLEPLGWTSTVTVGGLTRLEIQSRGTKIRRIINKNLGSTHRSFTQVIALPTSPMLHFPRYEYDDSSRHYTIWYRIEPGVQGVFTRHHPDTVFATRAHRGGVTYTTVSGRVRLSRIEICPVLPLPPTPTLPPRPVFPATAARGLRFRRGVALTTGSPLNSVQNPSCIPILADADANENNTARLKVTYYRPNILRFTRDDTRLEWSAAPANRVRFLNNNNHGLSVKVYGRGTSASPDIDVTFTLKFQGEECAKFRAVLGPVKKITCRFNIFNGPRGPRGDRGRYQPRATPADVLHHMNMANVFLYQTGIQMQLDTNTTLNRRRPGGGRRLSVTTTDTTGIYRIRVPRNATRNVPDNHPWVRANYRANVMNFCYMKSDAGGNLGSAFKWPAHPGAATATSASHGRWNFTENGTPSTSWIQPSGNPPDSAATTKTMKVIGEGNFGALPADLSGMSIFDGNDPSSAAGRVEFAGTIAHEIGHMLCLGHRIEDASIAGQWYDDELTFPPRQNLMHFNASSATAQDFDIAQTKVMRTCSLVT